jgi:hypothetical protein
MNRATLGDELVLLTQRADGRPLIWAGVRSFGTAGALLADLALAGRVTCTSGKVIVTSPARTGKGELDAVLTQIAAARRARRPAWWVYRLASAERTQQLQKRLAKRGILRVGRLPSGWRTARYPEQDPQPAAELRARLASALTSQAEPDPRTAALAALVHACGASRKVLPDLDRRTLSRRMNEISRDQWAAAGVRGAIRTVWCRLPWAALMAP